MLNPAVLKPLWRAQTIKWEELGEKHLDTIVSMTKEVALKLFNMTSIKFGLTAGAKEKLETAILAFEETERKATMAKLHEECVRNNTMALQTTNPMFLATVSEARLQRFRQALARYQRVHPPKGFIAQTFGDVESTIDYNTWAILDGSLTGIEALFNEIHHHGSRSLNIEDEIHDILKAYYEVRITLTASYVCLPFNRSLYKTS